MPHVIWVELILIVILFASLRRPAFALTRQATARSSLKQVPFCDEAVKLLV